MSEYAFACELAVSAGKKLLAIRARGFSVGSKGGDVRDILTSADTELHTYLVEEIERMFPGAIVYSEEGRKMDSVERMWVLDPVDGSANFSRGIPHYAVCIGVVAGGEAILGAVYNPATDELFSFEKGKGAFLNGQPIVVSSAKILSEAHVFFHAGRKDSLREWGGESYKKLLGHVRKTSNLASSSLDTCFVAAGRIEGNVYGTLSTLDIAPALGLLKEAGGVYSDEYGHTPSLSSEPQKIFMGNNAPMLEALRNLLQ